MPWDISDIWEACGAATLFVLTVSGTTLKILSFKLSSHVLFIVNYPAGGVLGLGVSPQVLSFIVLQQLISEGITTVLDVALLGLTTASILCLGPLPVTTVVNASVITQIHTWVLCACSFSRISSNCFLSWSTSHQIYLVFSCSLLPQKEFKSTAMPKIKIFCCP